MFKQLLTFPLMLIKFISHAMKLIESNVYSEKVSLFVENENKKVSIAKNMKPR